MSDILLLSTVLPNGAGGSLLGGFQLSDGVIMTDTELAAQTLLMLRRRSNLDDEELFTGLLENGWSNGALKIVAPDVPVTAADTPGLDTRADGGTAFDPEGLCAEYYREAKGYWPGSKSRDHMDTDTGIDVDMIPDMDCYDLDPQGGDPCTACVMEPLPGEMWHGVAHTEGRSTGKRVWLPGALSWREPPFAFHWQTKSSAHGGTPETVQVGTVTRMERVGDEIHAWGNIDVDDPYGSEFARKLLGGFITGISMGPGDEKIEYEAIYPADAGLGMGEGPDEWVFTDYPIGELTAVSVPAQAGAYIEPLPGLGEMMRPVVASAADAGQEEEEGIVVASGSSWTIEIPDLPPPEWFEEPDCEPGLAVTVTDEGRIFGYVAPKHTAHRSYWRNGERKTLASLPPTDFSRWQKETIVAGGGRVLAGPITMECMHAPTQGYGTLDRRHQYYEDSCAVIARAAVGDNEHGRWIAGAMMPGVTAEQFLKFMACDVSLDQQPHPEKPGWQDFVGVLAVPVGGWPKERHETSVPVVRVQEDQEHGPVIVASAVPVRHERGQEMDDIITAAGGGCPACSPHVHTCRGQDGLPAHPGQCRGGGSGGRLKVGKGGKGSGDMSGAKVGTRRGESLRDVPPKDMADYAAQISGNPSQEQLADFREGLKGRPVSDFRAIARAIDKRQGSEEGPGWDALEDVFLEEQLKAKRRANTAKAQAGAAGRVGAQEIRRSIADARKRTNIVVGLPVMYAAAGVDPTAMIRESMLTATALMGE